MEEQNIIKGDHVMNEIEKLLLETDRNISRARSLLMERRKDNPPKTSSFIITHWDVDKIFENTTVLRHVLSFVRNLSDLLSASQVCGLWKGLLEEDETWQYFSEQLFVSATEKHVHEHHGSWKSFYFHYQTSDLANYPVFYERKYLFVEKRIANKEEISIYVNFVSGDTFRYIFPVNHTVDNMIMDLAHDIGILNQEEYGLKRPDTAHTWLSRKKTLTAQDVGSESFLLLRRQLYIPGHKNTVLFLDYPEGVEKFVSGEYPCNRSTAIVLAAFIIFVKYGPHKSEMKKKNLVKLEECLPKIFHSEEKKSISEIFEHYQSFKINKKSEGKKAFLSRIRSLPSYGKTVFPVEFNKTNQNLCISFSHPVLYLDNGTSTTVIANSFLELKEWKASLVYLDIDVKSSKTKFLKNPQAYPQAQPPPSPQSPSPTNSNPRSPQKTPEKDQLVAPSTPLQQSPNQQGSNSPLSRFAKIQKIKGFKFDTERGAEIGEVVSRALAIQKLIKHGKLVRDIEIPILFGFEKGQVGTVVISTSLRVENFLNGWKKKKNLRGNMWGLLLKDEGIWMNGNEIFGSYNLYSLVGGVILKPIVSPLMIRLCDNTIEMVEVDYSAKVIDVIEGVCKSWNISPQGLCLKLGDKILDFVSTLSKQHISERDILDFCYEFLPQINDRDNEITTYLKYIQAKELIKKEEQIENITEKDIINIGASQMLINGIDLKTFVKVLPPKFKKEEENYFTEQIGKQHEKFKTKKMNTLQAQAKYIKSFGYHTVSFPVTHNSEEKTLSINEKEISLTLIEKPSTILSTVTPVETTSRFFQALGFGNTPPQPPSPLKQEEKKVVTRWNMHLLRNFSREDKQIKIHINMEQIVVSSLQCKEIMNALEIYSSYVKENILSRIPNPRNSNLDHIYYERITFSDEMIKQLAASISQHPPTSLTLNWCSMTTPQAETLSEALQDAPLLTTLHLNGFKDPPEDMMTPFAVLAAALSKAKTLTRVIVMDARLGEKDLEALRLLAQNEQVRYLNMCFTALPKQYLIDLQMLLSKREIILDVEVVPDETELVPWISRHYKI